MGSPTPQPIYTAWQATAVTPSDSTDLGHVRALYIGGAGNVSVIMWGGATVVFTAAVAGSILPVQVSKVLSTNTTATAIVALY